MTRTTREVNTSDACPSLHAETPISSHDGPAEMFYLTVLKLVVGECALVGSLTLQRRFPSCAGHGPQCCCCRLSGREPVELHNTLLMSGEEKGGEREEWLKTDGALLQGNKPGRKNIVLCVSSL